MKKSLLLTAAVAAATLSMSAQTVVNNPANSGYFGIRASGTLTCPTKVEFGGYKEEMFKKGGGFSAGLFYQAPVVANFYVEPGVSFYYNATGLKDYEVAGYSALEHASMRESGMLVPVMLGYHFDFTDDVNLQVFVGPELRVGFSNDMYVTTKEVLGKSFHSAPSMYSDDALFKMNRVNCNLRFGAGFNLARNYYIGISGAVGLTNASAIDNVTFHQNSVDFTIGYNFR